MRTLVTLMPLNLYYYSLDTPMLHSEWHRSPRCRRTCTNGTLIIAAMCRSGLNACERDDAYLGLLYCIVCSELLGLGSMHT